MSGGVRTCPTCGTDASGAAQASEGEHDAPAPGDPTVCSRCGSISIIDVDGSLRIATVPDVLALEPSLRERVRAASILCIRRARARGRA